jgi:antirestriction protein
VPHQLPDVLAQLDVNASIVEAQLEQLVSTALVAGMQLRLPGLYVICCCIQGHLVVCRHTHGSKGQQQEQEHELWW